MYKRSAGALGSAETETEATDDEDDAFSSTWTDFLPEQGHFRPKSRHLLEVLPPLFFSSVAGFRIDMATAPGGFCKSPVWLFQLASDEAVGVALKDRGR